jgi:hypothetical protein
MFDLIHPQEILAELFLGDLIEELVVDAVDFEDTVVGPRIVCDHLVVRPWLTGGSSATLIAAPACAFSAAGVSPSCGVGGFWGSCRAQMGSAGVTTPCETARTICCAEAPNTNAAMPAAARVHIASLRFRIMGHLYRGFER